MSLVIYTQFGGRHHRYKSIRGTLVEILDPWERRTLSLSSMWLRDLWLCCRADPAVETVVVRPAPLEYLEFGERHRGVANLAVRVKGSWTYHALLMQDSEKSRQQQHHLRRGALAHGVHQKVWNHEELSRFGLLIQNMGHLRQCLAVWLDWNLVAIQSSVLAVLENGALCRGQLKGTIQAQFGEEGELQSDAAIFRLFFAQRVALDLNRRYDDESLIELI